MDRNGSTGKLCDKTAEGVDFRTPDIGRPIYLVRNINILNEVRIIHRNAAKSHLSQTKRNRTANASCANNGYRIDKFARGQNVQLPGEICLHGPNLSASARETASVRLSLSGTTSSPRNGIRLRRFTFARISSMHPSKTSCDASDKTAKTGTSRLNGNGLYTSIRHWYSRHLFTTKLIIKSVR